MTTSNGRTSEFEIDTFFLDRWSPRSFTDELIAEETMLSILDAAHWAPSSGNSQPWRFIYGLRGTQEFSDLLDLLVPGNQRWAQNAGALIIMVSKAYRLNKAGERQPTRTHSFDTGAAWFSITTQALKLGYHAHGMEGLDYDRAATVIGLPDGYQVEAAAAIGRIGPKELLPDDLQAREVPSERRPVAEIAFAGRFSGNP